MSQTKLSNVSSSLVLAQSGACQITGYAIYNPNSTDTWIHLRDSTDVSSAATGGTSTYKILVPSNSQVVESVPSGNTTDPDGIWAFSNGITVKVVTGYSDTNNTPPSSAIDIFLQTKP